MATPEAAAGDGSSNEVCENNENPEASSSVLHVPTAVRSLLPSPLLNPGSATLAVGDHSSGFQCVSSRVSEAGEGEGPSVVRDGNGRSFSVPARMGLSSSMELPGMSFEDSSVTPSSLLGATAEQTASSAGNSGVTSVDCSDVAATTPASESVPVSSSMTDLESSLGQTGDVAFSLEAMDAAGEQDEQELAAGDPGTDLVDNNLVDERVSEDNADVVAPMPPAQAACAVNSAFFEAPGSVELITTETRSTPVDGTQSASAALMRNMVDSIPGLEIGSSSASERLFTSKPSCSSSQQFGASQAGPLAGKRLPSLQTALPVSIVVSDISPATPVQQFTTDSGDRKIIRKKIVDDKEIEESPIPSLKELQDMLQGQKKVFESQLEEMQKLLAVQYSLTGVNPLFQELGASVLGPRAVKKPEESLMPEALRFLRDVYAVKDTVTKKEARDLSTLSGATRTQVREFFVGQQSRVKRLIQVSTDGVDVSNAPEESQTYFFPTNTSGITSLTTLDAFEKLFEFMRAEHTFSGQSNIVQLILQADNVPGLRLLLDKGGLRILSKWLSQAAAEEQTSLVRLIQKVLFHLPMIHANPAHVSPIVQTMTRLRAYFATDVATRARSLITKWSKLFSRTGVGKMLGAAAEPKKTDGSGGQDVGRQSSSSGLSQGGSGPDKKKLKTDASSADNRLESQKPQLNKPSPAGPNLKGLDMSERPSSSVNLRRSLQTIEDPVLANQASKKRLAEHGKEKRRVVLVEELTATNRRVRDPDARRSSGMDKGSRPLSADDIQKAKMRARLLQGSNPNAAKLRTQDGPGNRADVSQGNIRQRENNVAQPSRSTSLQPQPPEAGATNSVQHFQAAHALPNRQDSLQPTFQAQVSDVGATNNVQHFQAAHALPTRQDPVQPAIEAQPTLPMQPQAQVIPGQPQITFPPPVQTQVTMPSAAQVTLPAPFQMLQQSLPGLNVQLATSNLGQAAKQAKPESTVSEETGSGQQSLAPEAAPERTPMEVENEGTGTDHIVQEVQEAYPLDAPPKVLIGELLKRVISWSIPPVVAIDPDWSVALGEESKEREVQSMRIKREVEEFYSDLDSIPRNPKDPWDEEQDYDDTLTLQVPLESEDGQDKDSSLQVQAAPQQVPAQPSVPAPTSVPSHDPELLALLLRNPALVSELASAQGLQVLKDSTGGQIKPVQSNQLQPLQQPQMLQPGTSFPIPQQQFQSGPGPVRPHVDPYREYGGGGREQQQQYFGSGVHPGSRPLPDALLGHNHPNASSADVVGRVPWNPLEMFQGVKHHHSVHPHQQQQQQQQHQQQPQQQQHHQATGFGSGGGGGGGGGYLAGSNFIPQARDFNANGLPAGNPQVWNRVSNNNLSFGNNNQGMDLGLRPMLPPNNVVVDPTRFSRPPPQQQQQQQQQHHQTSWYNTSIPPPPPPRPGW